MRPFPVLAVEQVFSSSQVERPSSRTVSQILEPNVRPPLSLPSFFCKFPDRLSSLPDDLFAFVIGFFSRIQYVILYATGIVAQRASQLGARLRSQEQGNPTPNQCSSYK